MTDASVWIPKEDSICSKCNEHQYLTEFLISIVQNMSGNPSVPHEVLWLVQLMVLAVQGVTHFVFLHYRGGSCLQDSQFGGKKSFPLSAAPCWYPAQEHLVSLDILSLQWFFRQDRMWWVAVSYHHNEDTNWFWVQILIQFTPRSLTTHKGGKKDENLKNKHKHGWQNIHPDIYITQFF